MRDRFVRFYNLPELMAVFREVADIKTADMLDIPGLPAVRSGKAEIVSVEATPAQQAIMADFILRAEAIRTGRVKPEEDNMLKLTGEARLMAIDPRLIRPDADGTGSKLNVCIEDVYQVWKDTAASASTQLVFCDVGTPKAGKFNVYDEIRNVLLAKGVPESEIAFVHDATSEAQRQELFERTRQGKVRILIGSTGKLGTGVNVQNMNPSQRFGSGWRNTLSRSGWPRRSQKSRWMAAARFIPSSVRSGMARMEPLILIPLRRRNCASSPISNILPSCPPSRNRCCPFWNGAVSR